LRNELLHVIKQVKSSAPKTKPDHVSEHFDVAAIHKAFQSSTFTPWMKVLPRLTLI